MARLINVTKFRRGEDVNYKKEYFLDREGIIKIGRKGYVDEKFDVGFDVSHDCISRQHAFILGRDEGYYIGNISTMENSGTRLERKRFVLGYYGPIELRNILEFSFFNELFDKERKLVGKLRDDVEGLLKKEYLFDSFLKIDENVRRLIEQGFLVGLNHKDIINIYIYKLQFRES